MHGHFARTEASSESGPSPDLIRLAGSDPAAGGAQCFIYAHPDNPALLLKVMKNRPRVWYRRQFSRAGHLMPVVREIEEYIAVQNSAPQDAELVERVIGVATTDLGVALTVEALRDRAGRLAPTLRDIVQAGPLSEALHAPLRLFLHRLLESDLILYDIRARNVVHAYDAARDQDRFVLVDGIGERRVFPISALIPGLNRFNKRRRIQRLLADIGLPDFLSGN